MNQDSTKDSVIKEFPEDEDLKYFVFVFEYPLFGVR